MQNATKPRNPLGAGRMTKWKNPTLRPWKLSLHVDHGKPGAVDADGRIVRRPIPGVCHEVVIAPGETVELPAEFDRAVQTLRCVSGCPAIAAMQCIDPTHEKEVVGGQGAKLVRVDGPVHRVSSLLLDHDVQAAQYEREERRKAAQREEELARLAAEEAKGGAP